VCFNFVTVFDNKEGKVGNMATVNVMISFPTEFYLKLSAEAEKLGKSIPALVREKVGSDAVRSGRPKLDADVKIRAMICDLQSFIADQKAGRPISEQRQKMSRYWAQELGKKGLHYPPDGWLLKGTPFEDLQPVTHPPIIIQDQGAAVPLKRRTKKGAK
jgi:hypothetical protein